MASAALAAIPLLGSLFAPTSPLVKLKEDVHYFQASLQREREQVLAAAHRLQEKALSETHELRDGIIYLQHIGRRDLLAVTQERATSRLRSHKVRMLRHAVVLSMLDDHSSNLDTVRTAILQRMGEAVPPSSRRCEGTRSPMPVDELEEQVKDLVGTPAAVLVRGMEQTAAMGWLHDEIERLDAQLTAEESSPEFTQALELLRARGAPLDIPARKAQYLHLLMDAALSVPTLLELQRLVNELLAGKQVVPNASSRSVRGETMEGKTAGDDAAPASSSVHSIPIYALHDVAHPSASLFFLSFLWPFEAALADSGLDAGTFFKVDRMALRELSVQAHAARSAAPNSGRGGVTAARMKEMPPEAQVRLAALLSLYVTGSFGPREQAAALWHSVASYSDAAFTSTLLLQLVSLFDHAFALRTTWLKLRHTLEAFSALMEDQRYPEGKLLQQLSQNLFIEHGGSGQYVYSADLPAHLQLDTPWEDIWATMPSEFTLDVSSFSPAAKQILAFGSVKAHSSRINAQVLQPTQMVGGSSVYMMSNDPVTAAQQLAALGIDLSGSGAVSVTSGMGHAGRMPPSPAPQAPGLPSAHSFYSSPGSFSSPPGPSDRSRSISMAGFDDPSLLVLHPTSASATTSGSCGYADGGPTGAVPPLSLSSSAALEGAMMGDGVRVVEPTARDVHAAIETECNLIADEYELGSPLSGLDPPAWTHPFAPLPANGSSILRLLVQNELSRRLLNALHCGSDVVRRHVLEGTSARPVAMDASGRVARSSGGTSGATGVVAAMQQLRVASTGSGRVLGCHGKTLKEFDDRWSSLRTELSWLEIDLNVLDERGLMWTPLPLHPCLQMDDLPLYTFPTLLLTSLSHCTDSFTVFACMQAAASSISMEAGARLVAAGKTKQDVAMDVLAPIATLCAARSQLEHPHATIAFIQGYGFDILSVPPSGLGDFSATVLEMGISAVVSLAAAARRDGDDDDASSLTSATSGVSSGRYKLDATRGAAAKASAAAMKASLVAAQRTVDSFSALPEVKTDSLLTTVDSVRASVRVLVAELDRLESLARRETSAHERASAYMEDIERLSSIFSSLRAKPAAKYKAKAKATGNSSSSGNSTAGGSNAPPSPAEEPYYFGKYTVSLFKRLAK